MPCCSLTVFLLSQPLMLLGSVRARLFKTSGIYRNPVVRFASDQRWLGLASLFVVEIVLVSAIAVYAGTSVMPAETHASRPSLWQICSIERLARAGRHQPLRQSQPKHQVLNNRALL